VTKMKRAGVPAPATLKSVALALKTTPVGGAGDVAPALPDAGMVTTSDCGLPAPSYRVDTPAPLSDTQKGPVGGKAMPHGVFRLASVCAAGANPRLARIVWLSVTRLLWPYEPVVAEPPATVSDTVTMTFGCPSSA